MRKLFLFACMMMVSLCLCAQNVNDLISDKTKDAAYSAPNTLLINKKWFAINDDFSVSTYYLIFKADKTGEIVTKYEYGDCTFDCITPITWSRDHNDLKTIWYNKKLTYRNLKYKDPSASERKKAEIKKGVQSFINEDIEKHCRIQTEIYYIDRLDSKYLLLDFQGGELISSDGSTRRNSTYGRNEEMYCTEAGKKEVETIKEAHKLNQEAYKLAKEGNYDEAITMIDKAIQLQPNKANWYDSKGEFLFKKGDKDGAKAMWDKVISLDPKFGEKKSDLYKLLFPSN